MTKRNEFVRELAKVFSTESDAIALLEDLGFPDARRPAWSATSDAGAFWRHVARQIEFGILQGSLEDLAHAASRQYPGNPVFRQASGTEGESREPAEWEERPYRVLIFRGSDKHAALLHLVRQMVDGDARLAYSTHRQVAMLISERAIDDLTQEGLSRLRLAASRIDDEVEVTFEQHRSRPYLFERLLVRGPDHQLFELAGVPSTTAVRDIPEAILSYYQDSAESSRIRRTAIDHVRPGNRVERLDPNQNLHEADVVDGDEFNILPESTAGGGGMEWPPSEELSGEGEPGERRINAWLTERPKGLQDPLRVGQRYTLNLQVGAPVLASLINDPGALVPTSDLPAGGLDTYWVISSFTVEMASMSARIRITTMRPNRGEPWTAQFPLHIPIEGPSEVRQIRIIPHAVDNNALDIMIYAGSELYRQFKVQLATEQAELEARKLSELPSKRESRDALSRVQPTHALKASTMPTGPATIHDDLPRTPAAHLLLRASHEWTMPPGELAIVVGPGTAFVMGEVGSGYVRQWAEWHGAQARVAGPIQNARAAAERFRSRWEGYLNDISPVDLEQRLQRPVLDVSWRELGDHADAAHTESWAEVAHSPELRDLAFDGHALYESFFPHGSELRTWIDALEPGHRIDLTWQPSPDQGGWIPHVPWGLMYRDEAPLPGHPVDPMEFLAFRYRLGYYAHKVPLASKALGSLEDTYRANLLYWGDQQGDMTGTEARWQQEWLAAWQNQVFVPVLGPKSEQPKLELLRLLNEPKPAPMTVLYLFCQCAGDPNDPVLRFGSTLQAMDVVRRTEVGQRPLIDRPFVFANACTTTTTDPYMASQLEEGFFGRGARAFLGTETKTPIQFASRFALIFFHFFYRKIDPAPMAAGEAAAQSRLFLWTNYKNIGGLFYTYINQYELFAARDSEVRALGS